MVEYIAYINCYLQFPNSESPMLSLKRCIRSVFCMEFFSTLFSFQEMLFVFLGSVVWKVSVLAAEQLVLNQRRSNEI